MAVYHIKSAYLHLTYPFLGVCHFLGVHFYLHNLSIIFIFIGAISLSDGWIREEEHFIVACPPVCTEAAYANARLVADT